jgi:hypothetical protein
MEEVETTLEDLAAMAAVVDTVEAVVEEAASAVVTAIVEAAEVVEVTEEAEAAMVVTTIVEAAEAEVTEGVAVVIKKGIAIATATPEVMPGVVVIRLGELDQVQPEVMTTKEVEVLTKKTRAEEATALAVDLAHPTRKAEQALIQPLNRTLTKTILQATEECVVDKDSEEAVEEVALTLQTQPVLPEAPAQFT